MRSVKGGGGLLGAQVVAGSVVVVVLLMWVNGLFHQRVEMSPYLAELARNGSQPRVDVFVVLYKPSCINRAAIQALAQHTARRIFVVTPERYCRIVETFDPAVRCMDETKVVPGLTVPALAAIMEELGLGQARAGWYFQQFMKLLAWRNVPDVTPLFLVWDSDMIMLPQYRSLDLKGRLRLMRDDTPPVMAHDWYRNMTGWPLYDSHHDFVAHQMPVYKPFMLEVLKALQLEDPLHASPPTVLAWVRRNMQAVQQRFVATGLSEYMVYCWHLIMHHPEQTALVEGVHFERDYSLHPLTQAARLLDGNCCPREAILHAYLQQVAKQPGLEYAGYELGHGLGQCNFKAAPFADMYFHPSEMAQYQALLPPLAAT
ncbi:uncharacterized protein MONBRDRAFT_7819 [Monosiga brevicollis MX1]|uniref:Uncharacterized protein n=1 Tax=Monosiga brevicollis TaxID=81824 RepID=A9UXI2_MONBE|nr:uncharacterized protein MONBRDRAFT_7819 [Monosiga brevicollis MX1]EDQ90012.1 predicted protein [Monosiga brevicollis MX1]|eukprot:XP_001745434.1 hypothetical protein [Monosiga brevicollis MX1]